MDMPVTQHPKKNASKPPAAAGRRVGVQQVSARRVLSSVLTPKVDIQPKLKIGKSGDAHEREADRVAEHVVSQSSLRTPVIASSEKSKPALQRPPSITPVIQQQSAEPDHEENQLQEEAQVTQGMTIQLQEEAAVEGEEVQSIIQFQPDAGAGRKSGRSSVSAIASSNDRPNGRAPPLLGDRQHSRASRAPPIQLKSLAIQPKTGPLYPLRLQCLSAPGGDAAFHPVQEHAEVRPEVLQCRGPPVQGRSSAAEDRLEQEIRQRCGGGAPLPEKTRIQMETGIGADFSKVRVHTDASADRMNTMLGSQAFTSGNAIFFATGNYNPESRDGQRLLAHELTHTVQQNASSRQEISPSLKQRAPPSHNTTAAIQGGFIGDRLNEYARHVPGWELFTVIIGYNPLTEADVDRTPQNLLRGFMGLIPGGTALYDKLNENGLIDDAFTWLERQLNELDLSWERLRNAIDAAWEEMDFIRWDPFDYNLRVLKRHLLPLWNDVKEFANRVIDKTVELVRTTMLTPLVNFIKERTRAYPLLCVILGEDPVTGEPVERSLYNIVAAFLMLTESGEEYLNKLNESGKLRELSDWLDAEIERLDVSIDTVTNAFSEAWELLDLDAVLHPIDTFTRLYNIFSGPVTRLFNFVVTVALKVLGLIKDWLIGLLKEYANDIPGYPLLRVILGRDPLTGEAVPRTAQNFIMGFLSFVPGGREKFRNLQESGAIDKAFAWLEDAIARLGLIGEALLNAFLQIWETFTINDLVNPVAAFERVVAIFTEPVRMIIDFALEVGMKILEFIFEGVLGPTGARVLAILKRARSTFTKIIKDPISFVGNLIEAVKKGFRQFSGNILQHLQAGLIGWLTGTLGSANITLPQRFDFKGILSLVMQVLGITWPRVRQKLVRRLGERAVAALETGFEVVRILVTEGPAGLWRHLMQHLENLKNTVIDGIKNFIITRIVTAAVTRIATMLNPAGAVIQAIIAIYNTIMFFVERINQIIDLVEAVVNSIANIAAGNINAAANYVEQSMARTIPVIISFLARLIGLGNIAGSIQNILRRVQRVVDRAIDRVLDWIVRQARRLLNRLMGSRGRNVDPNSLSPAQKKARARTEMEQFIRSGNKTGAQIRAKLPEIKRNNALSDIRLTFTNEGPRVEYIASEPIYTKLTGEGEGTQDARGEQTSRFVSHPSRSGATPYAAVVSVFGADNVRRERFENRSQNLLIPDAVVAEKQGRGSSEGRGSSAFVSGVGHAGIDEQMIATGERTTIYRGGHLVAWNVMGNASNQGFNLAPQVNRFNAPAYFEVFEKVNMNSEGKVRISVNLGYDGQAYRVDQDTLRANRIIRRRDNTKPWAISIPKRIPESWAARAEALDGGTLAEGGVTSNTATADRGRVVITQSEFDTLNFNNVSTSDVTHNKWHSFRMRIIQGGRRENGAIRTGGERVLEVYGEQIDFKPPAPSSEPSDFSNPSPQPVQTKPEGSQNQSHDAAERNAEQVAGSFTEQVGAPPIREQDRFTISRKTDSTIAAQMDGRFQSRLSGSKSSGGALPGDVQVRMEKHIGADFSGVKVHTGSDAVRMNRAIQAQAFTHENHVYFNDGRYQPQTTAGKELLAHELTHVAQQDSGIRRQPEKAAATAQPSTSSQEQDRGPLMLGGAPMPDLEPPLAGEIKTPLQAEEQAEAEAGIPKDKQARKPDGKRSAKSAKESRRKADSDNAEKKAVPQTSVKKPGEKLPRKSVPMPLKGGTSENVMDDFMTASASRMATSFPTLGTTVSGTFKDEKKREADFAPKLTAKAGQGGTPTRAPPGEAKRSREAAIGEKQPKAVPPQKIAKHKDLAQPLKNARNNKALDQKASGGWLSWFKDRVLSFMSGIRTKDDGVNTRAGKPPKAELTGEANPNRAEKQRKTGDEQAGAEKDKVAAAIKANPGKDRIQPAPVEQDNTVAIEAAAQQVETRKQDDMADYAHMPLPENVRKQADLKMAPLLEKSLAKPKADVKKATDKRNSDKQTEVAKAKAEVSQRNLKADQDQKNIIDTSRNDVAVQQKNGLDEADRHIKEYRKKADKEQTTLRDSVKKRIDEDEGKAADKLKKAEEDADKEKKKKEAEAAAKKRELKRQQKKKSWWDRVVDAVKSAVKAITKAIDGIFDALRKAVKFIIDTAKKAALAVIELGRKFVVGLLNTFREFLKGIVTNLIGKVFPELAKKINKAIDTVVDKAIEGVNKAADALKKGVEALADALGKVLDKILSVFQTALKAAVQIAGAVLTGDFAEAAKIAFYAACDILGINPQSVINFIEKAGESLGKIFKSPSTFFNNVAKGVKKGIDQFVAKIKQHLLNGLIAWLTGAMGDIQITLPDKFDLKGIFSLVTQILGLTYANIRAKVVKKLGPNGEKIVSTLEKTFELVKDLVTKGPVALWERAKAYLSNLKDQVIEGIRNAVIEKVVKAGVVWLISMLNPASAIVKAIKMLYDLVMFFIERWDQIVAFATSIWNSVNALANGQVGAAANAVEQALAKSVPVILSLLASLLGLGGIGKSVQKVVKKIRKPIDNAVDKVIDFIVKQAKKLLNKMTGKADKPREKQTPQEREKNKKACEKEIRAIVAKGTTFGAFKAMIPKLKQKYQVEAIKMDADFDIKVVNSDPSEIKVAVAHDIGLDKEGKLVEAKASTTGKDGEQKYDRPKPVEEFTFGTINSSADHPPTLKAVLERELQNHQLSLAEIEYNRYFSGFPETAARPSRVSGTIYGYIAGKIGAQARTGTSSVVGKMGNREASFREGGFKGSDRGYDGGHLISHSFGGPDAYYNLVPMKARVNRQVYGKIEKFMRNQVRIDAAALPLDKKKSNLEIDVSMNYGSNSYDINMKQFLKVAAGGLKSEKEKLTQQQDEALAKKLKLSEIKQGLPKDPEKAAAMLKQFKSERDAKKERLKQLRRTEERDRMVWNMTQHSGLKSVSGELSSRKQAQAQVNQALKIVAPLTQLIIDMKAFDPAAVLIRALETRLRVIEKLIEAYGDAYKDKPTHAGDRRLAMQGLLLRAHVRGLQKPRDITRALEKELSRMPVIPESEKEIDAKIREYDTKIQHAITELSRTDQTQKLDTLKDKRFANAGTASVHSRIPTSFNVTLDYEAIADKKGAALIKGDTKGTRKAYSKSDFETPAGASKASYGVITVSDAKPSTPLVAEEKAQKHDTAKRSGSSEEETAGKAGGTGAAGAKQRFTSSFSIVQA